MSYSFQFRDVFAQQDAIVDGIVVTLQLSAVTISLGFVFGTLLAIVLVYGRPWAVSCARVYVEVIRNTPLIVQLFLIFFGFNKSNLTSQALATVRQAATAAQQNGTAKIRVVGHTDRAGSLSYNKALSMRRAGTVKDALIVEGVMGSAIAIAGRGEDEPIVPTADGAREPQNRRVKITF